MEGTLCSDETPESISNCLKALAPFNLNKTELLMIINTPPSTALEIQLVCIAFNFFCYLNVLLKMIEESEERLMEEQVDQILKIVAKHFPHIIKEKNSEEDEDES